MIMLVAGLRNDNTVAARIDICTLHIELVLEYSVLVRVLHVYAQYISAIVYAYNQSCLGNVHIGDHDVI